MGGSKPRDADAPDGRVIVLSLFRGMSGPRANTSHLAPPVHRRGVALGDRDREGG
jgi:hypothetical protein